MKVSSTFALVALLGCAHAPRLPEALRGELEASPGRYLTGEVTGLTPPLVLEDRDFVYDVAFSPDGQRVAYSHLGLRKFQVGTWQLGNAPKLLADPPVTEQRWDVEGVLLAPPPQDAVVAVSRDGAVQLFTASSGQRVKTTKLEEPLVSVALHPSGKWLLVGSSRGLVTALNWPALTFAAELRVHTDEVRALAVAPDGRIFTGGWDRSVAVLTASEAPASSSVRTRYERTAGLASLRATLDGASGTFVLDKRATVNLVSTELAKEAGVDVLSLQESVRVPTAMGESLSKLAADRTLRLKGLALPGLTFAVCDACLPAGVQGVLGATFMERVDVAFDQAQEELVLTRKTDAPEGEPSCALTLQRRFALEGFVNDVSLDAAGARLGVALAARKAERTRADYEREKRGEEEPVGESSGALLDAADGRVLRRWTTHAGIVSTAAISPDGKTLVTGGWDNALHVLQESRDTPVEVVRFGWIVRKIRFSPDGSRLAVAAWTPQNPFGEQRSDPAASVHEVVYSAPAVR